MNPLQSVIQPMLGLAAWNARREVGSYLRMEFGTAVSKGMKATSLRPEYTYEIGEWSLWIYDSQWRIEHNNDIIASSQSERNETIEAALQKINGLSIASIEVNEPMWDTLFRFSDGYTLRTFSIDTAEDYWKLRTSEGWLVANADRNWALKE